ncbi:MAG TPA: 50S ribosomal protein L29 [Candidatus Magasanikbacteria bacterium]|nr:MAG: 50S ribosomal protein L29 [Candidatus Magasanikbacteria bacterium RIFCSPLOWO2_02_FULL_47_16]OGH79321.1 MAG: 50S ribosomal protein L29 [Candidatus Magasanikbacteria bacterium RIFCSPHIGHO2_02_FULL_48_18]OGH81884.1 MAG: 50S ribosomal protein L29 [Candidatus Magasanikbacteria bacterium RIFCSPLOWO2_12_FULL_47_9b]HAZ28435.1 50S ribosomal protein L29 [Candidatus Magasanikbacteria bacterium]
MDVKELIQKTEQELSLLVEEKQKELHALRMKVFQRQLHNVRAIRKTRKDIGQISTVLHNKQQQNIGDTSR